MLPLVVALVLSAGVLADGASAGVFSGGVAALSPTAGGVGARAGIDALLASAGALATLALLRKPTALPVLPRLRPGF